MHDAKLFDKRSSTKEVIPTLQHAQLVKVDNGIMLRGLEDGGYQKHQRQTWWVLPGVMDDLTVWTPDG